MTVVRMAPNTAQAPGVRKRRSLVERTNPSSGQRPLVCLSCVGKYIPRQSLGVFWESDIDPKICTDEDWDRGSRARSTFKRIDGAIRRKADVSRYHLRRDRPTAEPTHFVTSVDED